jgi:hypothetical protein
MDGLMLLNIETVCEPTTYRCFVLCQSFRQYTLSSSAALLRLSQPSAGLSTYKYPHAPASQPCALPLQSEQTDLMQAA